MDLATIDSCLRSAASARPSELALADAPNRSSFFSGEPVRLTWAELDAAVSSVAGELEALGAGPETPVAVQLPNVVELVLTILACSRLGATAVPFPIQHRRHELTNGIRVASPGVFVTGDRPDRPDQVEEVSAVIADLGHELVIATVAQASTAQAGAGVARLDWNTSAIPQDPVAAPTDVVTVCWTSGTTGTPKGVPRTNAMWLASGRFQVDQLQLAGTDRILCPFPVVNMAGIGGMVLPWVIAAAELHLHQPLDLPIFLQQAASEAITYTVAPPPLLNMLLAKPELLAQFDLSALTRIASGSAPLDPNMVQGWQDRGVEIINIFGSNEGAAMLSTKASVPDPSQRARFFPRPDREGVRTRLVDLDTGEEVSEAGRLGELRFDGPTVFSGYLESDGGEFDEDGFYRTGDLFEWVDQPPTLLRFVDRAKDIIIRGGMNISAAEVEGLLAAHNAVVESAAVGFADPEMGERLGVFVVAAPGTSPTLEELVEHLRGLGVASYKLPEKLEIVEALPRNPVGKVTKTELREMWLPGSSG